VLVVPVRRLRFRPQHHNQIPYKLNNISWRVYRIPPSLIPSTPEMVNPSAVGRVRIFPLTCPGRLVVGNTTSSSSSRSGTAIAAATTLSAPDEYCAIVARLTMLPTTPADDEKRILKECVESCSDYLRSTLGMDVSVV